MVSSYTEGLLPNRAFAFACKRKDIDRALEREAGVPVDAIHLIGGGRLRSNSRRIKVATAAYVVGDKARVTLEPQARRSLNVYAVPAGEHRLVRAQVREHGLQKLLSWLQSCEQRSAFWQAHDHWADLIFDTRTAALTFRERS